MDQDGGLYNNPAIENVSKKFCSKIYPISPDLSHQNGLVERAHCTFSKGMNALLFGAGVDVKFWPYDFVHVLSVCSGFPGQG